MVHGVRMTKMMISSKMLCDRGGGKGFGWKTSKVPRYICEVKRNIQKESMISDNEERFCDLGSTAKDMRLSMGNIAGVENIVQSE